jgi:hypothetical protein
MWSSQAHISYSFYHSINQIVRKTDEVWGIIRKRQQLFTVKGDPKKSNIVVAELENPYAAAADVYDEAAVEQVPLRAEDLSGVHSIAVMIAYSRGGTHFGDKLAHGLEVL